MSYIGNDMQIRMNLLGLTSAEVADKTFLDEEMIQAIVNNEIALEDIDEFDLSLLCNVLHCRVDFFTNINMREKDLLLSSMNRGLDDKKSMNVKARLQDYMNDYAFVTDVLSEME